LASLSRATSLGHAWSRIGLVSLMVETRSSFPAAPHLCPAVKDAHPFRVRDNSRDSPPFEKCRPDLLTVAEKRLAPRRRVVRVCFAFRPEIRAVFVFNQTIVYHV